MRANANRRPSDGEMHADLTLKTEAALRKLDDDFTLATTVKLHRLR